EALGRRFVERKPARVEVERLKAAVRARLERLIRLNRTRIDFLEQFEQLLESYNNGSRNIEEMLEQLLHFTSLLSEEEKRHVRENLTEEELVIFDILTRPAPELSTE